MVALISSDTFSTKKEIRKVKMRLSGGIKKIHSVFLYYFVTLKGVVSHSAEPHGLGAPLHISLTSYPPRFSQLHATLISILNQSVQPDRVTLWIAREHQDQLPSKVMDLQKSGLVISYCDDLRSYKKIIPELLQFPDSNIVIADDDVFYPHNWLKTLISAAGGKNEVIASRAHEIVMESSNIPSSYNTWNKRGGTKRASPLNFATGIGGVLYPPGSFHQDVTNEDLFMKLCPRADDVWLYWMIRQNGWSVKTAGEQTDFSTWVGSQRVGLHMLNTTKGAVGNDEQIQNMLKHYGWPENG